MSAVHCISINTLSSVILDDKELDDVLENLYFDPDDHSEDLQLQALDCGINSLMQDSTTYLNQPCSACGGKGHTFESFPFLEDTNKVKRAYGIIQNTLQKSCA